MTPVGVVLAGGAGRRLGGRKAVALLDGVSLVERALAVLAAVTDTRAVVVKAATQLPRVAADVHRWVEPETPQHPAMGIAYALERAAGRAVLCIAVDLPLLDPPTLKLLLAADDGLHPCVVARVEGRLQPLCAIWRPEATPTLAGAEGTSMRSLVAALGPQEVDMPDPACFLNVNTATELAQAERVLRGS